MIIKVKVIPNSKTESVQKTGKDSYKVKIREKAIEGRANAAVADALSNHLGIKKANISIVHGNRGREKAVEITGLLAPQESYGRTITSKQDDGAG